jgi:uncharacterized membrane protein YphA (DoxX/SURF4 family)
MVDKKYIGTLILRLALAFVFLWFGFSQLADAAKWTSFVPEWATTIMNAGTLVLFNGFFEIVAGAFLAVGVFSRYIALLLGLHLLIIGVSMGLSPVGVRDIGLALASISFFFLAAKEVQMSTIQ